MKSNDTVPNDAPLRALLHESRPAPPLPARFVESVWRRIERVDRAPQPAETAGWVDRWIERLLRPRLAFASAAALFLLSALAGGWNGAAAARQAAQDRYLASVAPWNVR